MEKNQILNSYSKSEFQQFLVNDTTGKILELLDSDGINILKNSKLKEDRINYILTYSNYKNELLQNKDFLELVLNNNSIYYAYFDNLNSLTYDIIIKSCFEMNIPSKKIADLFCKFNINYKKSILKKWPYSKELLNSIFVIENDSNIVKEILDNYNIDLCDCNVDLNSFFYNTKMMVLKSRLNRNVYGENNADITIPSSMINLDLMKTIWNNYNIFTIRNMVNNAQYFTDVSALNEFIKNEEDKNISEYDNNTIMSPYIDIYNSFKEYKTAEKSDDVEQYEKYRKEFFNLISKENNKNLFDELYIKYNKNNINAVKDYLKELSDRNISNYIIDYHFEENYHNIMIDINELLRFYYDGNITLDEEKVYLYEKILNIDNLEVEEKQELHNYLKNINVIEMFYEDMSMARKVVNEAIKYYSLTQESLSKYRDYKLSEMYGVDVYNIDKKPFFGIVKTGIRGSDSLPTGHSYSLIGRGGLAVYGNVGDSNTFLYDADDLNPEQIIHVFPFDSFTYYHPLEYSEESTNRVNVLMMPSDLVKSTPLYNEILILEKGKNRTDFDTTIPELKRIALYCVDEIKSDDVKRAKDTGVGIILVKSSNYIEKNQKKLDYIENPYEYNYLNDSYDITKFESKR